MQSASERRISIYGIFAAIVIAALLAFGLACATPQSALAKSSAVKTITAQYANTGKVSIEQGSKYDLKVKASPAGAKLKYLSSNQKVATVSAKGVIKAIKPGATTITIKSAAGNVKKKVKVIVLAKGKFKAVKKINVKPTSKNVVVKGTLKLTTSFKPKNASNRNLIFKSSNTKVATVSAKGVVKGVKPGKAKITVQSAQNPKAKRIVTVTVKKEDKVETDSDGDGVSDWVERTYYGTDPNKKNDFSKIEMKGKTEYADNAVTVSKSATVLSESSSSAKIQVPGASGDFKVGSVALFPNVNGGDPIAVKVSKVTQNGGNVIVEGSIPELGEVYKSINEEFTSTKIDASKIVINDKLQADTLSPASNNALSTLAGKTGVDVKVSDDAVTFAINAKYDGNSISGSLKIKPKATYKINAVPNPKSPSSKSLLFAYTGFDLSFDVDSSLKASTSTSETFKLADIPLPGGDALTGCGSFAEIKLKFSLSGEATVSISHVQHLIVGYSMLGGPTVKSYATNVNNPSFEVKSSAKVGVLVYPTFKLFGKELLSAGVEGGISADLSIKDHPQQKIVCADVSRYFYLDAFAEALAGFGDKSHPEKNLRASVSVYNKKNTPYVNEGHWENWVIVPECTISSLPNNAVYDKNKGLPLIEDNGYGVVPNLANKSGSSSYHNKLVEPFNVYAGNSVTIGADGEKALNFSCQSAPGTIFRYMKTSWDGEVLAEKIVADWWSGPSWHGDNIWKIEVLCGRLTINDITAWSPPSVVVGSCETIEYPLSLSATELDMDVGQKYMLKVSDNLSKLLGSTPSFGWNGTNVTQRNIDPGYANENSVVYFDVESGMIKALHKGTATLTVSCFGGKQSRTCTINVR